MNRRREHLELYHSRTRMHGLGLPNDTSTQNSYLTEAVAAELTRVEVDAEREGLVAFPPLEDEPVERPGGHLPEHARRRVPRIEGVPSGNVRVAWIHDARRFVVVVGARGEMVRG